MIFNTAPNRIPTDVINFIYQLIERQYRIDPNHPIVTRLIHNINNEPELNKILFNILSSPQITQHGQISSQLLANILLHSNNLPKWLDIAEQDLIQSEHHRATIQSAVNYGSILERIPAVNGGGEPQRSILSTIDRQPPQDIDTIGTVSDETLAPHLSVSEHSIPVRNIHFTNMNADPQLLIDTNKFICHGIYGATPSSNCRMHSYLIEYKNPISNISTIIRDWYKNNNGARRDEWIVFIQYQQLNTLNMPTNDFMSIRNKLSEHMKSENKFDAITALNGANKLTQEVYSIIEDLITKRYGEYVSRYIRLIASNQVARFKGIDTKKDIAVVQDLSAKNCLSSDPGFIDALAKVNNYTIASIFDDKFRVATTTDLDMIMRCDDIVREDNQPIADILNEVTIISQPRLICITNIGLTQQHLFPTLFNSHREIFNDGPTPDMCYISPDAEFSKNSLIARWIVPMDDNSRLFLCNRDVHQIPGIMGMY